MDIHKQMEEARAADLAAANTAEALLMLCLPHVAHSASEGVIGAAQLLEKIKAMLGGEYDA